MFQYNGELKKWELIKWTAIVKSEQLTNTKEGFSEDTEFIENTITPEQKIELDKLNELEDPASVLPDEIDDIIKTVVEGPVDDRTDLEKLADKLVELDPEMVKNPLISDAIYIWNEDPESGDQDRAIGQGRLVLYKGVIYKTIHAKRTFDKTPPDELVGVMYTRIGALDTDGTVKVEEWRQPTGAHDAYPKGAEVLYKGIVWISKIPANMTIPDGDVPHNRYWEPK